MVYIYKCPTKEYCGKTTQQISQRFYQHYMSVINKELTKPVSEHFNLRGHTINDMKMIPFEKLRDKNETRLTIREKYWIVEKDSVTKGLNKIL